MTKVAWVGFIAVLLALLVINTQACPHLLGKQHRGANPHCADDDGGGDDGMTDDTGSDDNFADTIIADDNTDDNTNDDGTDDSTDDGPGAEPTETRDFVSSNDPADEGDSTEAKVDDDAAYYNNLFRNPTSLDDAIAIAKEQVWYLMSNTEGLAAKLVRLTFHDCVGGCDGCVDLNNPSNFGLRVPINAISPVVHHNKAYLTTGDVWALAGLVASERSQDASTNVDFPMQFVGRPHCDNQSTTSGPHREMPSSHFTTNEILTFFRNTFNFSPQESVCILGAHTLGKATSANSGFGGDGGWDANSAVLNNEYYVELLDFAQFELELEENSAFPPFPDQVYWEEKVAEGAPPGTFMLQADMALAFDMGGQVNPTTGDVACTLVQEEGTGRSVCPTSPLLPQTIAYANDNDLWMADFRNAYLKMVSTGCGNGVCQAI